jgi:hypothetical protein
MKAVVTFGISVSVEMSVTLTACLLCVCRSRSHWCDVISSSWCDT